MSLPIVPNDHQHHPSLVIKHYMDLVADNPTLQRSCLEFANIPAESITDPHHKVSPNQEFQFLNHLLGEEKGSLLGFDAGKSFHVNCHEHLGFAALSSNTPFEALTSLVNFSELTYSFFTLSLIAEKDFVKLQFDEQYDLEQLRTFYLLRDITFMITVAKELIPQRQDLALCHSITMAISSSSFTPEDLEKIENYFQCPLHLDADSSFIQYSSQALRNSLPQANPLMHQLFSQRCEDELEKKAKIVTFTSQVRLCIQQTEGKIPTFDDICSQLNTSTRTAHRKLQQEGSGFKTLLAEELKTKATQLLKSGLPIKQIASDMGYNDTSSFINAFKRWTGDPPGVYLSKSQD